MFVPSIHASVAALAVYVVAVSAVPSLTPKTSTPIVNVDGLTKLKVSATIVNTGDETLTLFDDSRGVLDPLPENSTITDAAGPDDPSTLTVLPPGDSIDVGHHREQWIVSITFGYF